MTETLSLHLRIHGRVQGVWYRGWLIEQARARSLNGWVRNRADGSVEAVVSGPAEVVRELVEACRRGPPSAQVSRVDAVAAAVPEGAGFQRLATE